MAEFIKGMALCEGFFHDCAEPILTEYFPELVYSAALIGYGSDVLGYDDPVSADHMWGPRFHLFLAPEDMRLADAVMDTLSARLPCTYRGYSVNFSEPDPNDNGVRHPAFVTEGPVHPLIFITTFADFLTEQIGCADPDRLTPADWLSLSEHRLLSIVSGKFFHDGLGCAHTVEKLRYYPRDVRLYLIASCWYIIASEQAFLRRAGDVGDDIGSRLICARIAERLMRLCFLLQGVYAPYSKWFGTAFTGLPACHGIRKAIGDALSADTLSLREDRLICAMAATAELQNQSGLTKPVPVQIRSYYGRKIKVIFAEQWAEAARDAITDPAVAALPSIGSFSQLSGLSDFSDVPENYRKIADFYKA